MELLHTATEDPALRVLHVEADDADAELVAAAFDLSDGRFELRRVRSVSEALQVLHRAPPFEDEPDVHVIITNLHLADLDAFDLIDELRGNDELKGVPVVVLSGSRSVRAIDRAYRAGASAFIVKPNDLTKLSEVVSLLERFYLDAAAVVTSRHDARIPT